MDGKPAGPALPLVRLALWAYEILARYTARSMVEDGGGDMMRGGRRSLPDPSSGWDWEKRRVIGTWEGIRQYRHFSEVEAFALFIGYPRSGHSLIGSLLNAHPDVVIAHELNVCRFVHQGFHRLSLFGSIFERDRAFGSIGRRWNEYEYVVPDQFQGRVRHLRVIGDKRGSTTTRWLRREPELLDRLRRVVRAPLRMLHVTRNPFDNIATMSSRAGDPIGIAIDHFDSLCRGVASIRARLDPGEMLDVRYEDFVRDPRTALTGLCRFLDLEHPEAYLEACASLVWPSGSQSRQRIEWNDEDRARVDAIIEAHSVFEGYSFER